MKNNYYIALFIALIWGCASKVQPTGGPKDEEPPILVASTPVFGQRNYKEQTVSLIFNEDIKIKGLREQLLITPRIEGEYEFKVKKKKIYLEFELPFDDSTTYTLNFRDGIVDVTEGNSAQNLQLAFSTGNLLDTLEIKGMVIDLLTKKVVDGATVALYAVDDTLDIFTGAPYYLTKTNKQGKYQFKNLKDGTYRIYSFIDDNKNLTCQTDLEDYSFLPDPIVLDTAIIADTLSMFHLNIDTLKVLRTRPTGRYYVVSANKYLVKAHLESASDSTLYYKYTDDRKGLKLYNTFSIKDSLQVFSTIQDSLGFIVRDSFYVSFPETKRKADEFLIKLTEPIASAKRKVLTGEISFDKPLKKIYLDSISLRRDSLTQFYVYNSLSYSLDTMENILSYSIDIPQAMLDSLANKNMAKTLGTKAKKGKSVKGYFELSIPPMAFLSVENDSSQQLNNPIIFINPEQTGMVLGTITSDWNSYFIQLLDNKFTVVKEQYGGKSYSFTEIKPGEYFIRIMVDENENGRWDPGDIRHNILPEKVILYKDEAGNSKTVIRANWDISIDLSF